MRLPAAIALVLLAVPGSAQEPAKTGGGWVVLPVAEYRALRASAFPSDPEPPPPPVEAVLTRVDYDLRANGEAASGVARLSVDVFKQGWVALSVPDGLLVSAARLDGRPVSLVEGPAGKGVGAPQVLLSRAGPATITLDVAIPVRAAAGVETLALPAAPAALTRATLVLPQVGVDVSVSGGLLLESPEKGRFVAATRAGQALTFAWRKKRDDRRATLPVRLRGGVTTLVGLAEDTAQITAEVRLSVVQGQASSVSLELPAGVVVNEVSGALVSDWSADAHALKVSFLEPLEGEASFTLAGELHVAREGRLAVPLLRLRETEREAGGVAVEVLGAGEIKAVAPRALDPADPAELGGPLVGKDSPSLVAFRYRPQEGKEPRALEVEVARYTPQAVLVANVEDLRCRVLLTDEGKRLIETRYAVRNNQRGFLALTLPEGATLWSAAVDGRPVRPGKGPAGTLLLPLRKGRPGEAPPRSLVQLVYVERAAAFTQQGKTSFELPRSDLPVSRTGLELYYPPRYKLTLAGGPLRVSSYVPAEGYLNVDGLAANDERNVSAEELERTREEDKPGKKLDNELQGLLDRYQKENKVRRVAGVLPLSVPFPALGPSLYLASELTAEGQAPAVELGYRRGVK